LPKSYVAQWENNEEVLGDAFDAGIGLGTTPYFKLDNGNIASIDFNSNYFRNGIFIYDAYDEETIDPINGWWVAFKVSDSDPTLLEKIAERKMTTDYFNFGSDRTHNPIGQDNVCKYIRHSFPANDGDLLFSTVTTLTISLVGNTYTLTANENTFNYNTDIDRTFNSFCSDGYERICFDGSYGNCDSSICLL
jgi:hypothetical protein